MLAARLEVVPFPIVPASAMSNAAALNSSPQRLKPGSFFGCWRHDWKSCPSRSPSSSSVSVTGRQWASKAQNQESICAEVDCGIKKSEVRSPREKVRGQKFKVRGPKSKPNSSVSAGLDLAWYQDGATADALAGMIGESVQNGGHRRVCGQYPDDHNRDGGKRQCESNQQRAQVRPTFPLSAGGKLRNPCCAIPIRYPGPTLYSR